MEAVLPDNVDQKIFEWSRNGQVLEEGSKYNMFPNGSLFIKDVGKSVYALMVRSVIRIMINGFSS